MEAVSPVLPASGDLEDTYRASDGTDRYTDLPTFKTENSIVSRWKLSDEERKHIASGGDLFIAILNFGSPIWPIMPIAADPDTVLETVLQVEASV